MFENIFNNVLIIGLPFFQQCADYWAAIWNIQFYKNNDTSIVTDTVKFF